jgi:GNAT superfamily N-acetyltransferase
MAQDSNIRIKLATEKDIPILLAFIRGLAEYEQLLDEVIATEERLHQTLFGARRFAEAIIAYEADSPAGFALFFHNYSTFLAKPGIYLEDLFVQPTARGKGIGRKLLAYLARLAKERNCGRLEWAVLNWNERAIHFYKEMEARPMNEWIVFRLAGDSLEKLATEE